jgi:hypothetical protein
MSREATNKLLEAIEEGRLPKSAVILECLSYMSEDDVADMCHCAGFLDDEEGDE